MPPVYAGRMPHRLGVRKRRPCGVAIKLVAFGSTFQTARPRLRRGRGGMRLTQHPTQGAPDGIHILIRPSKHAIDDHIDSGYEDRERRRRVASHSGQTVGAIHICRRVPV